MTLTTRDAFVDVQHPPALPGGRVIHLRKPLQDANLKLLRERRDMRKRCGFSLLEILLALAILGGSLALLSRIVETGTSAAREARDLSVARILCQTKLSELLLDSMTGISPQSVPLGPLESFDSQSSTPFYYSVEVQSAPLDGLLVIRVVVEAQDPNGGPPLASYSLTRWMVDPALGLEEAEAEEEALKEEAAAAAEASA